MLETEEERVCLDARRHGIVLVRPFVQAGVAAVGGVSGITLGWPASPVGVALLAVAAFVAVRAAWEWDRTHVVLTTKKLFVVHGTVRRRAAAVRLAKVQRVEVEQSLLGRLLGYGTLVAGELEIRFVPQPRRVYGLVERLVG